VAPRRCRRRRCRPQMAMLRARAAVPMTEWLSTRSEAGSTIAAPSTATSCMGGEAPDARRGGGEQRGGAEHGEAGREHAAPAEAVTEGAGGQQRAGEGEVVGVDHPLQRRHPRRRGRRRCG